MITVTDVSVERDMLPVMVLSGHYVPDPKWQYVDEAGHRHRWSVALKRWPLLVRHQDPEWVDADGDEHNGDVWYTCRKCAERIEPGFNYVPPSPWPTCIPGMWRATFAGETDEALTPGQTVDLTFRESALSGIVTRVDGISVAGELTGDLSAAFA